MFTWTINENVSNFAPVKLTYTVKLVNKSTVSGTYTPSTNKYAKLKPVSSNGKKGIVQEFNKPTVSYTVGGGNGGHDHYHPTTPPRPRDSHTPQDRRYDDMAEHTALLRDKVSK